MYGHGTYIYFIQLADTSSLILSMTHETHFVQPRLFNFANTVSLPLSDWIKCEKVTILYIFIMFAYFCYAVLY